MTKHLFVGTNQGVAVCERFGDSWRQLDHVLIGLPVTSLVTCSGIALAGTTGGIYRSQDLGQTWQTGNEGLATPHVRRLAYHADNSELIYAGTEPAAIFVSTDAGATWRECREVAEMREMYNWFLPYSPEAGCVRGFAFYGSRVYAAVEQGGVLSSDDAGGTWRLAQGGSDGPGLVSNSETTIHADVYSILAHPTYANRIYACTGGGFYRSTDGGGTWECLYECYCRAAWIDPQNPSRIILGPADGVDQKGRVEETRDDGRTWHVASAWLDVPWPGHMVERFVQIDDELLAVLSNGEVIAASVAVPLWRRVLPRIKGVKDVTRGPAI